MKWAPACLLIAMACAAERPYVHAEPPVQPLQHETGMHVSADVLENGLQLIVGERSGTVAYAGYVWKPSTRETIVSESILAILQSDARVTELRERFGARVWGVVDQEGGRFGFELRRDDLEAAMTVVADMIGHPDCAEATMQRVARSHHDARSPLLGGVRVDPSAPSWATTCASLDVWWRRVLDPARSALVVAGDVSLGEAKRMARAVAALPRGDAAPLREMYPVFRPGVTQTRGSAEHTRIEIGRVVPRSTLDVVQLETMLRWEEPLRHVFSRIAPRDAVKVREQSDGVHISVSFVVPAAETVRAVLTASAILEGFARTIGNDLYEPSRRAILQQDRLYKSERCDDLADLLVRAFQRGHPYDEPLQRTAAILTWPEHESEGWALRALDTDAMIVVLEGDPTYTRPVPEAWSLRKNH